MTGIQTKESPFTPGRPVQPEYFIARRNEVERLERAVRQAASGRNENVFIAGERGIGKSSLVGFIRYLAEKKYNMLGCHCYLGGVRTLPELMRVVFQRLLQECDENLLEKLGSIFKKFIKGVGLFGVSVEFTDDKEQLAMLADNFLPAMRQIQDTIEKAGKKGLVLILDDLNGIAGVPEFAEFLKSFVDELATSHKAMPLLLMLVGVRDRRDALIKSQPSVARIFDVIDLPAMSDDEVEVFFQKYFDKCGVSIDNSALGRMVNFSAGLPMLMHEIGDAVFWANNNDVIDERDSLTGVLNAADNVGKKYIDPKITDVLRSSRYPQILWNVAGKSPVEAVFTREELLDGADTDGERYSIDNFLTKIKKLGFIAVVSGRGQYKFVNPLFRLYLWSEADRRKNKKV
jgi:DNA replication protein DnaC